MEEKQVEYLSKAFGTVIFVISLVSSYFVYVENGVTGLIRGLSFVYLAAVLLYGIFTDSFFEPLTRFGFGIGMVAFGISNIFYAKNELLFLILIVSGILMSLDQLRKWVVKEKQ